MSGNRRQKGSNGLRYDAGKSLWIATASVTVNGVRHRPSASAPGPKTGKAATEAKKLALSRLDGKIEKLRAKLAKEAKGIPVKDGYTLWDCVTEFLDEEDARPANDKKKVDARSVDHMRLRAGKWIAPTIGKRKLSDLTVHEAQTWLDTCGASLGFQSVSKLRSMIVRAVKRAQRQEIIEKNVFELTEVTVYQDGHPSDAMTETQARAFLRAAEGHFTYAAFVTQIGLGVRPGEVLALEWQHIDLTNGVLHVRTALSGKTKTTTAQRPQGSSRSLALPRFVWDVLATLEPGQATERVFTRDGRALSLTAYRYWLRKFASRAKVGDWHPHELRHTGASIMRANGCTVDQVSEVLGHVQGSSITRGYALHDVSADPKPIDHHVSAMEKWWNGGQAKRSLKAV